MTLVIKNGKFTLSGDVEKNPEPSKSGKTFVLASTHGFVKGTDDKGREVMYSLNIVTKEKK